MKILLIYPPITEQEVYSQYAEAAPCLPPLGICYLAKYLLNAGYEVKLLDSVVENLSLEQLKKRMKDYSPDIVGVSSTTVAFYYAKKVISLTKSIDPEKITILGGPHITACPEGTMEECKDLDIGVLGEGEETVLNIVKKLKNRDSLADVKGIIYRNNGDVIRNKPQLAIQDLDSIPFPARELLPDLRLYTHTVYRGKMSKLTTTMITSRGCPFQCAYCDQSIYGRTWRKHSADYVFSEMKYLKETYGVNFFSIEDDNFLLFKPRVEELCHKIINDSLNIGWACSGRVNSMDEKLMKLMKKAGCESIYIGIESGSPRILELIHKNISKEEIAEGIKKIKSIGFRVVGSFIFGIPSETKEEMKQTMDFALTLPLDGASFFTFTPYPNTEMRKLAFQYGKVSHNWKDYSGHPSSLPYIPNGMTQEELLILQENAYKKFLLRPSFIWKFVRSHSLQDNCQKAWSFFKAFYLNKMVGHKKA